MGSSPTGPTSSEHVFQLFLTLYLTVLHKNYIIVIRERQKEGIALAKSRGIYKGRTKPCAMTK